MEIISRSVEVIAWFNKEGNPRPIRFKIAAEDEEENVIKVDKILFNYMEKLAGNPMLVFRCKSMINEVEKIFELKYELGTMKWKLFKI